MSKKKEETKTGQMPESERIILYKILFEMRGTIKELEHKVRELEKQVNEMNDSRVKLQTRQHDILIDIPYDYDEEFIEDYDVDDKYLDLNTLTRNMLENALQRCNGNRKKAANYLGISERTFYRRLKQVGIA